MKYNIAIIGSTGLVGRNTLQILVEQGLVEHNYYLFASARSVGKTQKIGKTKHVVQLLNKEDLLNRHFDFALFCTRENISKTYVKLLAKKGTKVIDFSSAFRKNYPLIVPEINFDDIGNSNIICNPNCSTIQSVVALNNISKKFGLTDIVFSTYQAVSGAGKNAIDDLTQSNPRKLKKLDYPIVNNAIPYIGDIDKFGYCVEENKMMFETAKILHLTNTNIIANCVRIPVKNCHLVSVVFKTYKSSALKQIQSILSKSKGVCFAQNILPMPINANNKNDVIVGRLKNHKNLKNCFSFFVCGDNLRKGASLNAVQILKNLIQKNN